MEKKKVIVRGDRSGVFFGTLEMRNGREVKLSNCRRLWYWDGAASDFQLATNGVAAPRNCKFTVVVSEIEILVVFGRVRDCRHLFAFFPFTLDKVLDKFFGEYAAVRQIVVVLFEGVKRGVERRR